MTTANRKRTRLIEKLKELNTALVTIKTATKGSADAKSPLHDADALYVDRQTLIELLEEGWIPGELTNWM